MKKCMLVLAVVAGVALFAGSAASTAEAHDEYHHGHHHGHHNQSYGYGRGGYGRGGYGGGYYRAPVVRNQVILSTNGFTIGFGGQVVQPVYQPRRVLVPVYPQQYYRPGCGW